MSDISSEYLDHRQLMAQATAADDLLSRVQVRRAQPKEGAPAAPATAPVEADGEGNAAIRVVKDVSKGLVETPRAVVKGVRDAYQSTINMAAEVGSWIEGAANLPGLKVTADGIEFVGNEELKGLKRFGFQLPDIGAPKSVTGSMVKGVAQFLTGMKGADKLLKAGGVVNTTNYSASALKGAIANFAAFDPHQNRLSNLIEQFPALQNPVSAFLASDPADNAAEGRFKNALEGLTLGVMTDGFFKAVKLLRATAAAKRTADAVPDAVVGARELPDDAFRLMGDDTLEAGTPLVQTRPKAGTPKPPTVDPGDLKSAGGEDEVFINFARIDTADDVKRAMQELADASKEGIDTARRGVQTFEKIKLNAGEQNAWNLLKNRRMGEPLNAEQSVAARQLWASSGKKLTELAEAASTNPSEGNLFAFRKMLTVHDAIQKEVIAARTETARALASWRIPVGDSVERLRDIAGVLDQAGGPEVSRELAERVAALAKAGMHNELASVVEKTAYATTRDAMLEGWINGLLSNPATHMANTVSNTSVMFLRMAERATAAKIASVLGDSGSVAAGEASAQWHGLVTGLKDALRYSWKAAKTGDSGYGLGKIETPRTPAIGSEAFGLSSSGWMGRGADMLGSIVRTPGRALQAEDEFFKTLGYRMELHAHALRQAASEVNAGSIADDAVGARIAEIVANPPRNIRLAAIDAATYQTFTNAPGKLAQSLSRITGQYPALKVILPFVRTPANILNFTFERTPLAPLMHDFRSSIAAGGPRRDLALAQLGLGTSVMMATADLALNGGITGRGPTEKGERQALSRSGWQPYSVKVGDRWFTYNRLDPVGSLLGLSADVVDALRNAQHDALDDPDTERLAVATSIAIAGNLVNKTYLSGLSSVFEAMSDPGAHGEATIQRMVGSVVPAGVASANRAFNDPYIREVYSMLDAIKARTPGLSDELGPRRNLWGEALKYESGIGSAYDFMAPVYTKPGAKEPIDEEILRIGANITMPSRKTAFNGARIDLTQYPKAYSRYIELAGNELKHPAWGLGAKDYLNAVVTGRHPLSAVYEIKSDGPDGGKDLFIRDALSQYRELARKQLLEEFPELRTEVDRKQAERRAIRMPVLR